MRRVGLGQGIAAMWREKKHRKAFYYKVNKRFFPCDTSFFLTVTNNPETGFTHPKFGWRDRVSPMKPKD
jgi:hypothetical protein